MSFKKMLRYNNINIDIWKNKINKKVINYNIQKNTYNNCFNDS